MTSEISPSPARRAWSSRIVTEVLLSNPLPHNAPLSMHIPLSRAEPVPEHRFLRIFRAPRSHLEAAAAGAVFGRAVHSCSASQNATRRVRKRAAGYLSRRGRAASRASCSCVVPRGTHHLRPRALAHSTSGVIPRVELHAELKLPGDQFVEAANSCVRHAEIRRRASLKPHGGCG